MSRDTSRRGFLIAAGTAAAAGLTLITPSKANAAAPAAQAPAGAAFNVAFVGVGGRGGANLGEIGKLVNVTALCDVDANVLKGAASRHPKASTFADYRKLLDDHKLFDAIVVSTPDHMHAPIALAAMSLGKHVYCEKPIAHDVAEVRLMVEAARKHKVVTQMGTQAHSSEGTRLVVEWIRAGAIGNVLEIHTWTDRAEGWWPQGFAKPTQTSSPPAHLDWDLWLGTAPQHPYYTIDQEGKRGGKGVSAFHPFRWRGWLDFGTGAMGDMACHIMDAPYWACQLTAPSTVEAQQEGLTDVAHPRWSLITWTFPANGPRPPLMMTWRDAKRLPPIPEEFPKSDKFPDNGTLFIGDKGKMLVPYGSAPRLLPEARMKEFPRPEKSIPRVEGGMAGHHRNWVEAVAAGKPEAAGSNFDYCGALNEIVLLGTVAVRAGKKIEWDSASQSIKNDPSLNHLLKRKYRPGYGA